MRIPAPATFRALVAERLDTVSPPARRLLQAAAVAGVDLGWPLLGTLTGLDPPAVAAAAAQATDGHTLLITNTGPLAVAPAMLSNVTYDPARSFTYITMFGGAPIVAQPEGVTA